MKLKAIKQKHQETSRSTENAEKPEIVYDEEIPVTRDAFHLPQCCRYVRLSPPANKVKGRSYLRNNSLARVFIGPDKT